MQDYNSDPKPGTIDYTVKGLGPVTAKALLDVMLERSRQIVEEGWTPEHDDDNYVRGELAAAGACYAANCRPGTYRRIANPLKWWPFAKEWWKPKDRRRDLVRAAALLVAEIEYGDRNGW